MESLGKAGLLKEHKLWESLPIDTDNQSDGNSDSDCDEESEIPTGPLLKTCTRNNMQLKMLSILKLTSKPCLLVS